MRWTSSLTHGLAKHLATRGIGVYSPTGVYRDDEVGIVIGTVPAAPPRVLVLSLYPLVDDVDQADSVLGLQVELRVEPVLFALRVSCVRPRRQRSSRGT